MKEVDKMRAFGFSSRAGRAVTQPISYLLKQGISNPDVISLAAGLVDYETLPATEVRKLVTEILSDDQSAQAALQYGTTEGLLALREAMLNHLVELDGLSRGDMDATADDVVLTSGSQQLLFMLTDILIDPGDIVITGWPSYFVYTGTLEAAGAEVRCVEMDAHGILPDSLDSLLGELATTGALPRVKILYICSYHQNPTGITLSQDRKQAILDIVRRYSTAHRILLLEDAAYRELTYEGDPPHSFKYYDRENKYVALLQTFSKPFAPGLRTGYGLLPGDLVGPISLQKGNHDFGSSNLCQHILMAAVTGGGYQKQLETLRRRYAAKRDAMLGALDEHMNDLPCGPASWTHPSGGLYVYLTLPESIDTGRDGELFSKALSDGVMYVPGEFCYPADSARLAPCSAIRLSFGVAGIDDIRIGIERLAGAVRSVGGA